MWTMLIVYILRAVPILSFVYSVLCSGQAISLRISCSILRYVHFVLQDQRPYYFSTTRDFSGYMQWEREQLNWFIYFHCSKIYTMTVNMVFVFTFATSLQVSICFIADYTKSMNRRLQAKPNGLLMSFIYLVRAAVAIILHNVAVKLVNSQFLHYIIISIYK